MFRSFMAAGVRREASGNRILVRGALIFQRVIFRGGFPAFRRFGMRYSPDVGCGKSWLPRDREGARPSRELGVVKTSTCVLKCTQMSCARNSKDSGTLSQHDLPSTRP